MLLYLEAGIILALAVTLIWWRFQCWCDDRFKKMFEEFERTFPDGCASCSYNRFLRQQGLDPAPVPPHRCKERLHALRPHRREPPTDGSAS